MATAVISVAGSASSAVASAAQRSSRLKAKLLNLPGIRVEGINGEELASDKTARVRTERAKSEFSPPPSPLPSALRGRVSRSQEAGADSLDIIVIPSPPPPYVEPGSCRPLQDSRVRVYA